ncbi:MAG: NfeD family protein [Clostridiales bacterium]|nr:NfeD family protein [Clostridiales bacterium]
MEAIWWLGLFILCLVFEIVTLGLTSIWFAGGALVAFVASLLGANQGVQLVLFLLVSFLLLFFTRPFAKKYINKNMTKTNADSLVGRDARVIADIDNFKGVGDVIVAGQEWTARSDNSDELIPKGAQVEILKIEGVKLIVKKKEEEV